MKGSEFYEGIRCVLVDKNAKPKWKYSNVKDVPEEEVQTYFKTLPAEEELKL